MGDSQANDLSKIFSVRIVSIDYYMAPPIPDLDISYSSFQGGKVNEVPVIRVYGSTPAGQKTCLHIHRALPYFYVACSDLFLQSEQQDACTHALSLALEKALKLKGHAGSKRQHVHGCSLVRAKKFYGYHSSEDLFAKIYLYHPQDVARAASLLLGGAVLDKVLQPHESHIPFLLQFLVDYNLYGMGHLHVSKLKFRNPVPDSFCQRKIGYNGQQGEEADNSACMAAKSQAYLGGDLPIWISSTIPDGWIWQYPSQPGSASDQEFSPMKRQSTSELEGDAIVEEILNQQFISYTSLSQTHSEMKMVPSLIPIWEEFEKSGVQAAAVPPDPGKPLPEDVMKTLSKGLELENMLMEFSNDVKIYSFPKQSTNTSTNEENLIEPGHLILEGNTKEPLRFSNASNKEGLNLSHYAFLQGDDAKHHEDTDECPMKSSANQLQVSETVTQPDIKPSDQDALRLLKWLASSQAAEDINSDDELAHQTILSPLLPATNFDKVLEKASIDYESESQQECQDILDSVEVGVNFEELNRKASHRSSSKSLSTETIPQVDGSSDDLNPIPHADKASKLNIESQISPRVQSNFIASNTNDHKRKMPQWGSLPVSSSKRVNDSSRHSRVLDTVIGSDSELKDSAETSVLTEKKSGKCHSDVNASTDSNVGQKSGSSVILECSMRDLMRRKRSYRVEPSEYRNTGDGEYLMEDASHHVEWMGDEQDRRSVERIEDASLYSERRDDEQDQSSLASFIFRPSFADEHIECHRRNIYNALEACREACDNTPIKSSCTQIKSISSGNNNLFPSSISKDEVHSSGEAHAIKSVNQGSAECHEHRVGVSFLSNGKTEELPMSRKADNLTSTVGIPDGESYRDGALHCGTQPIGMTFYKKPPKIEWGDETCSSSQSIPNIRHDEEVTIEPFDPARVQEECLPFFSQECHEELEFQSVKSDNLQNNQKLAMGVPIHYQNDGSYLYMLTPVLSPPSIESVTIWLSSGGENILKENAPAVQALPSPKGSNTDLVDSQGSQPDMNGPSRESASLTNLRHNVDNEKTSDIKKSLFPDALRRAEQNEGLRCEPSVSYSEDVSQISGPERRSKLTPLSQMGFRDPANESGRQQLTLLSIEIQAESRGDLRPDPRFDAINVIVLIFQEDDYCGLDAVILLHSNSDIMRSNLDGVSGSKVFTFSDEKLMFRHFIKTICSSDPDILLGWDIQRESLGYLAERAAHLGINLVNSMSRTPSRISVASEDMNASEKVMSHDIVPESASTDTVETAIIEDEWGRTHASGIHVGGRIVLNVWRLMRGEVKLNFYTLEAVAEAVLRRKVPAIPCKVLTKWFSSGPGRARYRCIEYIAERAKLNLQIMNQLDMINRTSELARVFGIDFFSVLSRGSQYRVESMFLRLAHTQNYLAISPGNQQVAFQPAMECLPLVMEPESGFYSDPVVVLDFQSLYPSMIIAYNLCFCTCLGKVAPSKANTLGVSSYSPDRTFMQNMKDKILLTPNGVMYVPSKVRRGVLPRLLEEILSTRIMVKQAIKKLPPPQQVLHRIFDARQLALKLIANVTYGYTAAGFSGRMPCAELADSIVQCARRTLENAISFVHTCQKWQAKVIYGDTDSMFVLLKGRSVKESFQIGHEIAAAVTATNPYPVTLKMEKVYHPCFLLTKKRYVGYSYESSDQSKPKFDAKGIETVRRDTCVAVAKMMEQSLRVFFEHKEIDRVKAYILRQWKRILAGRVSLQDFVFAKEVRLGTYSARPSSLPPAAIVASKAMRADPRAEPLYAERVPYVVVHGEPGARLVDMVVDPQDLLAIDSPYRLNDIYYIRKQIIPALQRAFGLVGADLNQWFLDMPRPGREAVGKGHSSVPNAHRTRIDYYYLSKHCIMCAELVQGSANLCHHCSKNESAVATALTGRTSKLERDIQHLAAICRHCGGGDWLIESGIKCTSMACSVYFERRKIQKELRSLSAVATEAGLYPRCMVEWF